MSKLLEMEPPRDEPREQETPQKGPRQAKVERQDAIDGEAALHIELLAQTDVKLDRISVRLDQFCAEMDRLEHNMDAALQQRAPHQEETPQRPERPGLTVVGVCALLLLGSLGGFLSSMWRDRIPWGSEVDGDMTPLVNAAALLPDAEQAALAQPMAVSQSDAQAPSVEEAQNELPDATAPQLLPDAPQVTSTPPAPSTEEADPEPPEAAAQVSNNADAVQPASIQPINGRIRM